MALGDAGNSPRSAELQALITGLLIVAVNMALGYNTHLCLNCARDLGSRLAAIAVGYPVSVFTSNDCWWLWGPWAATISGAMTGALVYDLPMYRGEDSPVNYRCTVRELQSRQQEVTWLHMFRMRCKAEKIEKTIEEGKAIENSM